MFDWVPGFVMDIMSSKALTDATGWVKRESELEVQKKSLTSEPNNPKKGKGLFSIFQKKKRNSDEETRKAAILAAEQAAAEKAAREEREKRARTTSVIVIGLVLSNVILSLLVWRGISGSSS